LCCYWLLSAGLLYWAPKNLETILEMVHLDAVIGHLVMMKELDYV